MAAGDEGITIPITVTGADAAVADLNKPTQSLRQYIQEAGRFNKAERDRAREIAATARQTQTATAITEAMTRANQKSALSLESMGQGMNRAAGESAKMATALSLMGGAAGSSAGMVGKLAGGLSVFAAGPVGIAVAAVGLLAAAFSSAETKAEKTAAAIKKTTKSLEDFMAAAARASSQAAKRSEIGMGLGSITEQEGALRQAEEAYNASVKNRGSVRQTDDPALRAAVARARANLATARREQAEEVLGAGDVDVSPTRGGRGGGGRGGGGPVIEESRTWSEFQIGGGGLDRNRDAPSDLSGFLSSAAGSEHAFGGGGGKASGALASKDSVQPMIDNAKAVEDAWTSAGASITDSFADVFAALITGGKDASLAMLASLGDQMVGEGSRAIFSGLFQTALGNPMGPTMIAIGGAEIAAGVALGAVDGGAAAGAGGGARPSPGGSGAGPGGGGGDSGPTVINVYSMNPTAETGRAIDRSVRASNRKRGR